MTKTIFLIILTILAIAFLVASIFFFLEKERLNLTVAQGKQMIKKLETEFDKVKKEKENIDREKEGLRLKATSYLNLNNNLQDENKELKDRIGEFNQQIREKDAAIASLKLQVADKQKTKDRVVEDTIEQQELTQEINRLNKEIQSLTSTLTKDKAVFYYNLGVAYTKARLYPEAIDAYNKSLQLEPENAEAYYNLGVLNESINKEPELAIFYYEKYLELKPQAKDKDKVEAWIDNLKSAIFKP